jgi:hypothetical protein
MLDLKKTTKILKLYKVFLKRLDKAGKKYCTKCEKIYDKNDFYNMNNRPDGLSIYCKKCTKIYLGINRAGAKKIKRDVPKKKKCRTCKIVKKSGDFRACSTSRDGLDFECRKCRNKRSLAYNKKPREQRTRKKHV